MKTDPRSVILAGCLCSMVFGSAIAHAEGAGSAASGTITFMGAIVAPTCDVAAGPGSLPTVIDGVAASRTQWRTCAAPGNAVANASRIYAVSVVRLTSTESDPVLKYFDTYVKASGIHAKDPLLVTQTYE